MRLIDADALSADMFDEAFEKDSDMQKWDGGCCIRYKLFENTIRRQPTIDAVQVVRCKNCEHYDGQICCDPDSYYGMCVPADWYCAGGERRVQDG